jgi:hypothetical protein
MYRRAIAVNKLISFISFSKCKNLFLVLWLAQAAPGIKKQKINIKKVIVSARCQWL